jgi:hypothetical protein
MTRNRYAFSFPARAAFVRVVPVDLEVIRSKDGGPRDVDQSKKGDPNGAVGVALGLAIVATVLVVAVHVAFARDDVAMVGGAVEYPAIVQNLDAAGQSLHELLRRGRRLRS